ncbi:MAG: Asp-tRNA(Asn)/Glu-tRNA(Gln) amidotransferase subunit GatC [Gammaproteobacteria bacterium]
MPPPSFVNREQVAHIARLARIKIDPQQAESHARELSRILELVGEMNRIDTAGIAPMSHPQEAALRLRDDCAEPADPARREQYQRIAPSTRRGLYLAPKVIE